MNQQSRFDELKASGLLPSPKGVALAVMRLAQDDTATNAEMARMVDTSDEWIVSRCFRSRARSRSSATGATAAFVVSPFGFAFSAFSSASLTRASSSLVRRARSQASWVKYIA